MNSRLKPLAAVVAIALAGCAVTEPKTRVQIEMPQAYTESLATTSTAGVDHSGAE